VSTSGQNFFLRAESIVRDVELEHRKDVNKHNESKC